MNDYLGLAEDAASLGTAYLKLRCLVSEPEELGNTYMFETMLYGVLPLFLVILTGIVSLLTVWYSPENPSPQPHVSIYRPLTLVATPLLTYLYMLACADNAK